MARWVRAWAALLVALVTVTSGCLGTFTGAREPADTASSVDVDDDAHTPEARAAGSEELVSLTLVLALTEDSRIPLDLQTVSIQPEPTEALAIETSNGRLTPGEDARIVSATLPAGERIPETTVEISFFDGLGRANFTFHVAGFEATSDVRQVVLLRDEGPGRIGFVSAEGPLEVEPRKPHAVPQYGYLLYPDGDRRPLAGFDHVVHVPTRFPNLPAGEQARFRAEVPAGTDVLWQYDGGQVSQGTQVSVEPEPGRHQLRVSIGPGEDTATLSLHTDMERVVNGTIAAGGPADAPDVKTATAAEHGFAVDEYAHHATIVLRPVDPKHPLEDLDLVLEDEDGREVATSSTQNRTLEAISFPDPTPGNYTVRIDAKPGVVQDYSLSMRVDY